MTHRFATLRRLRRGAAAVALGLVLAIPVAAACAAGQAQQRPRLVLVSRDPVKVTGTRFSAHERVRVTVVARSTQTRKLTANAHGTFTTTFGPVVIDRCSAWSVTAVQRGHAPVVIRGAKPQCPPA